MTTEEMRQAIETYCRERELCSCCRLFEKNRNRCVFKMDKQQLRTAPEEMIEKWYAMAFEQKPQNTRESILKTASDIVNGHREQDYGTPENNFQCIAELWETYMKRKCLSADADVCFVAEDVAAMMILFKIGRMATGEGTTDTWIDIAGYAACGGEMRGNK